MGRGLFRGAVAASVLAVSAGAAELGEILAEADLVIATAQRQLGEAARRRAAARFDPREILAEVERVSSPSGRESLVTGVLRDLWYYYSYQALRHGGEQRCAPLGVIETRGTRIGEEDGFGPRRADIECRRRYHDMAFARALIGRTSDYAKICSARLMMDAPLASAEADSICSSWLAGGRTAASACARFDLHREREPTALTAQECLGMMNAYDGDDRLCAGTAEHPDEDSSWSSGDAMNVELCVSIAAYARASKGSGECGDREACRVMLDPASEAVLIEYEQRFKEKACGLFPTSMPHCSAESRRASEALREAYARRARRLDELLEKAQAALQAIPGERSAKVQERLSRIAELRQRAGRKE